MNIWTLWMKIFRRLFPHLARLVTVRTGNQPHLVENVSIDVVSYGAKLPLNQPTITADAHMLILMLGTRVLLVILVNSFSRIGLKSKQ